MFRIILIFFVSFFSMAGNASIYTGKIKSIGVGPHYDSICTKASCAVIMVEGSHTGATCQNGSWHYIFQTDTDSGKHLLSLVLAAKASAQEVVIGGTSLCNIDSNDNAETVNYIYHKF